MEAPPLNDCCSICHDDFTLACQANCSHWFCGACILRVWHHGSVLQACKCPICRRTISLLIPCEAALHQRYEPEARQVIEEVEKYNRSFGGSSLSLIQRIRDMPFLLRRLMRELLDPRRSLPLVFKARMIFSVLVSVIYVISPVDILPEGILGIIGLLDDCLIVLIVFLHLCTMYRSALVSRHGGA
ncbi:uncharacterized protein LOC116266643 [Nymphaea colorata]|nr:uncharacterized protein LOC116266643 [Nymphaea colorata]